ncbi:MAG: hypothetical protein LGR52_08340 [Candidatus Thiosymbion ectosymbiont of Robbea hypermnestra]|nr:hypothetical protein [Candidatus Thiosymbion ectosymbiont of Robbea hypermnestra]
MGFVLEILALSVVGLLIVHYVRRKDTVTYKKYLAVSDDTPLPIANCGVFDEPGKGPDEPLSVVDLDWERTRKSKGKMFVGVPDQVLAEDPEVEKYFPVIAEGNSMERYGIHEGDVAWVKTRKEKDSDSPVYAVDDRVLIISRSKDELKIRKLIEKLSGDQWRTGGCSPNSEEGEHAQKRFLGKVGFVTHRKRNCLAIQ